MLSGIPGNPGNVSSNIIIVVKNLLNRPRLCGLQFDTGWGKNVTEICCLVVVYSFEALNVREEHITTSVMVTVRNKRKWQAIGSLDEKVVCAMLSM